MNDLLMGLLMVAGGVLALWLAVVLVCALLVGALWLLIGSWGWGGLPGIVAYVLAWIFLAPLMVIAALVLGLLTWRAERRAARGLTTRGFRSVRI